MYLRFVTAAKGFRDGEDTVSDKEDNARDERIDNEIIVDGYGTDEQASAWHCHLEEMLTVPFSARCTTERVTSPLVEGDEVEVVEIGPQEDCRHEMLVFISWGGSSRRFAVPLSQLEVVTGSDDTRQAVEDWTYWSSRHAL